MQARRRFAGVATSTGALSHCARARRRRAPPQLARRTAANAIDLPAYARSAGEARRSRPARRRTRHARPCGRTSDRWPPSSAGTARRRPVAAPRNRRQAGASRSARPPHPVASQQHRRRRRAGAAAARRASGVDRLEALARDSASPRRTPPRRTRGRPRARARRSSVIAPPPSHARGRPGAGVGRSPDPGRLRADGHRRAVVRSTDRRRPRGRVYEWGERCS